MTKRNEISVSFFIKKTKLLQNGEAPVFARINCVSNITEFAVTAFVL